MPLGLAVDLSVMPRRPQPCAPPFWFRGVEGVRSAWPSSEGPFGRTPARLKGTGAQRAGIRYERKARAFLAKEFGKDFTPSQWFQYETDSGVNWCQPDGLLQINNLLVIIEVKVNFSSDAWWQLRKLYEPVVKAALNPTRLALAVVCKSFDPAVPFPESPYRLPSISALCNSPEWDCTRIGVVQWRS
jgi:hypothetical protein